jgi:hypothetical protein
MAMARRQLDVAKPALIEVLSAVPWCVGAQRLLGLMAHMR